MLNSKVLTYDYLRFLEKDEKTQEFTREIFAPFISVRISFDHKLSFPFHALVDSGAARNLLPAALGEQIQRVIFDENFHQVQLILKSES
ncbi:hypothetical protein HYT18_01385 [Candidatus Microgenomates bacterium]|nr:hypothetical protein [Candidatus Microgenomates bacterium]